MIGRSRAHTHIVAKHMHTRGIARAAMCGVLSEFVAFSLISASWFEKAWKMYAARHAFLWIANFFPAFCTDESMGVCSRICMHVIYVRYRFYKCNSSRAKA